MEDAKRKMLFEFGKTNEPMTSELMNQPKLIYVKNNAILLVPYNLNRIIFYLYAGVF